MISGSTLIINVCLNYLLIYGNLRLSGDGRARCAIATLVSRCVELLIVIWFLKFRETCSTSISASCCTSTPAMCRITCTFSLPVLINQALWGIAQMVQTGILGHLGGDVTAANAISVQVYQVLSVVCYGAASASAGIVVGRTIGEDNEKSCIRLSRRSRYCSSPSDCARDLRVSCCAVPHPCGLRRHF